MTNERRAELNRAMDGHGDDDPVLFLQGWSPAELTCGELRELLASAPQDKRARPEHQTLIDRLRWAANALQALPPTVVTQQVSDVMRDAAEALEASPPAASDASPEAAFREGYDFGQADAGWKVVDADDAWSKSGTRQNAPDPIAAAVDAQLDPLKDELKAIGHKLAKDVE